ncbi:MAG: 23S rRNA pseudouridine(2605) synthase RluB [Cellvibrio sp.]
MTKQKRPDSFESSTKAVKPVASKNKSTASKKAQDSSAVTTRSRNSKPAASGKHYAQSPAKKVSKTGAAAKVETEVETPVGEKLQKVLARMGIGSRREMERVIQEGRVKVNDQVANLGDRVTLEDKIFLDGQRIIQRAEVSRRRVILYNKPEGEICSRVDPDGRPTVYDNLPPIKGERWISVGRLDFNTSGLLLFTNDGEFANKLMHPSSVIDREYLVRIQGEVDDDMKKALREGVLLEDGVARFTDIVDGAGEGRNRWFYCVVMEGRNREVRRLWESQGVKVSRLKRVRYANIFIPSHVRVGQWTELTEQEIRDLSRIAGYEEETTTKVMRPSREEVNMLQRHEKKLRSSSSVPKRVKTTLRRKTKKPE